MFDFKSAELRHKTFANLIVVMNHVVTYFGPRECISNQKHYIRLQKWENTQAHQKEVCGIGSWSKFKDGIDATSVWRKPTTGRIRTSGFSW